MLKFFSVLFLILIIVASSAFVVIKSASLGASDNWFNLRYRSEISKSPELRNIFSLHFDGDAKADYLSKKNSDIVVEIDYLEGHMPDAQALSLVKSKIREITGKNVIEVQSSVLMSQKPEYTAEEIRAVYKQYKLHSPGDNKAIFYLLYLPYSADDESMLGSTLYEDGAVIFSQAMKEFDRARAREIEASTILHEFGHLLGLPHNEESDCIMNEALELGQQSGFVATDYCSFELKQLESIKTSL